MNSGSVSSKIDYVSVICEVDSHTEYKTKNNISELKKTLPSIWHNAQEHFKNGIVIDQAQQGWWLKIQCCPASHAGHSVKLSFNYQNKEALQLIANIVDKTVSGGWALFLDKGYITRIDFAIDFIGYKPTDFIWAVSHDYKKFSSYVNDQNGRLETAYIGSMKSSQHVIVYDRQAAQKVFEKDPVKGVLSVPDYEVTRVEARIKRNKKDNVLLKDAHTLTSILSTIHVLDAKFINKPLQESLNLMQSVGSQRHLSQNTKKASDFLPISICKDISEKLISNPINSHCKNMKIHIDELISSTPLAA